MSHAMCNRLPQHPAILLGLLITTCLFGVTMGGEPGMPHAVTRPCVLLKNGNVLLGTATQVGEFVVVTREDHCEIKLSRKDVACWADSVRNLYTYRVNQRSKNDPNALLRARINDIRWCLQYNLLDIAALELIEVYAVAPDHREAHRLEKRLRDTANRLETAGAEPDEEDLVEPQQAAKEDFASAHASKVYDAVVQSADGLSDFARYVQPLLINHCGQCHNHFNASSDRTWRLTTPPTGQRATARMTKENLKVTLAHIDLNSPTESKLLTRAEVAHGNEQTGSDPQLPANRRAATADTLRKWIASIGRAAGDPRVVEPQDVVMDTRSLGQFTSSSYTPQGDAPQDHVPDQAGTQPRWQTQVDGIDDDANADKQRQPARLPSIGNPFDPELFNRKYATDSS